MPCVQYWRARALFACAVVATMSAALPAQSPQPAPSCAADLERLIDKVEANYAGFVLEHRPDRAAYDRLLASLRPRASHTRGDDCFFLYRELIAFFDDPHLFVFQSSRLDSAVSARRAATVPTVELTEEQARASFTRHAGQLDPIEGIWYDGPLRVAVVRDVQAPGEFRAVVLRSDTSTWRPGAVRARFMKRADGGYDVDLSGRNHSRAWLDGRVHRQTVLRLSPGMWGKTFPVAPADSALLDPVDVHRPVLVHRDSLVVVAIPSHNPAYRGRLDSLVRQHHAALTSAKYLVIDLRGNEGGAAFMTDALLPFVMSTERREPLYPDFGEAVMLSSPDQITYVQRFMVFGADTTPRIQRLLARLRANPGALVPLSDSLDRSPVRPESVVPGPRRVAILVDRGTVSAAEAFLLRAMRSTRVAVFGEPTAGALDYQSTYIVPFQASERRWYLGYPTITASATLPKGGMRGKGIPPDVRVDWSRVSDPIGLAVRELSRLP